MKQNIERKISLVSRLDEQAVFKMNPAISDESLALIKKSFPTASSELKELLRVFDGQKPSSYALFGLYRFLTCEEMLSEHTSRQHGYDAVVTDHEISELPSGYCLGSAVLGILVSTIA